MKNKLFRLSLIWIFYLFCTGSFADELNISALEVILDKEKTIIYAESNYVGENYVSGYFNTTSAIDEISFRMASGDIDTGQISLYGVSN